MGTENKVYRPDLNNLGEPHEYSFIDNLAENWEQYLENWVKDRAEQQLEENVGEVNVQASQNLAGAAPLDDNLGGAGPQVEEENLATAGENFIGSTANQGEENLAGAAEAQTPQSWKDCPLHNEGNDEDCPLHNEGNDEESDEDVVQVISVDHMCRDEQLFASYFEELIREHGRPIVDTDGADGVNYNVLLRTRVGAQ